VLTRANGDPALPTTVAPGAYTIQSAIPQSPEQSPDSHSQSPNHLSPNHSIVRWDPSILSLGAEPPLGLRRAELIVKDVPKVAADAGLAAYTAWRQSRDDARARASVPSTSAQRATAWAANVKDTEPSAATAVELVELPRDENRPSGVRFGRLVHEVLATCPLGADLSAIQDLVRSRSRGLGATDEESAFASRVVHRVLAHPFLDRARLASANGLCRREVPVTWREPGGGLVEGVVDLAFRQGEAWTIIDFKTDEELRRAANYMAQVDLYTRAVGLSTGMVATGILMKI
jgi:ATP-dependent exoDNAse (exonuclease V) beta subunit